MTPELCPRSSRPRVHMPVCVCVYVRTEGEGVEPGAGVSVNLGGGVMLAAPPTLESPYSGTLPKALLLAPPAPLLQPSPGPTPHSAPSRPPEIRLPPFPALSLSLRGKPHLLHAGPGAACWWTLKHRTRALPAFRSLRASRGGGRGHQSMERGRACGGEGLGCDGGLSVSPLPSWGLQPPLPCSRQAQGPCLSFTACPS